ncbi:MAG TPA: hypothetical protein PKD12_02755 [Nitrospira sp.]|nr:hypothetical protein [Nitrospira sp.]
MDVKPFLILVVLVALAVSGCTTSAGGRWPAKGVVSPSDAPSAATIVQDDKLVISVIPERSHYLVGEPVYVAVRLRNSGDRTERVIESLHPEDGGVDLVITGPDGRAVPFVPYGETDRDTESNTSLSPGQTIGNMVPIFFGGNGWTFRKPGTYRIVAYFQFAAEKGKVRESKSAPATIEIVPSSQSTALVDDAEPVSQEVGKFLLWQAGDHLEKGLERLRALLDREPDSPLASYARFALGRSLSEPFMDYRKKTVRTPDCAVAQGYFSRVNDQHVTDYVRVQIAIAKGRCAAFEKDRKSAIPYFATAQDIMVNRPEYRTIEARVSEQVKHLTRD